MTDYRVKTSVKNNRILMHIESAGYPSVLSFATANGISVVAIYDYINLKRAAMTKRGRWTHVALKMAEALHTDPDCLFSEQQRDMALPRNSAERVYSEQRFMELARSTPELLALDHQADDALDKVLKQVLTEKQQKVLAWRFGLRGNEEHTLKEVGKKLDVSNQRVRQIENSAFRQLRKAMHLNPDVAELLHERLGV